ncbi:putative pentatricopeptide repeat-containing protein At3g11460, mitochondrial [Phoenix dactylifera]|uniref:Pentatricopeptide repeat-containing protein At3g11460, mitochondrial n=1 Tax=Phoenix dactylifera TaxID=42345 RepID=A0A8B9AFK2_PHODC|nr:putative pentatricopeptide repeat-containing protein At3g11460, mitochondrial [Phoenix dactylifera]
MLSRKRPLIPSSLLFLVKPIPMHIPWNGYLDISNSSFKSDIKREIPSLNHRIKHLAKNGFFDKARDLYQHLRVSDTKPDRFTFTYVLKSCVGISAMAEGMSIHSHIIKCGFEHNLFVMNSTIEMYSRFGSVASARRVFNEMPQRNLVSWNLMISGYGTNGYPEAAMELCSSMKHHGMALDKVGLMIVLPICGHVKAFRLGKSIHAHVVMLGLSRETAILTAVLDMYAKCGELDTAEQIFDEISNKDVVSWNAMITGYSQIGKPRLVLQLFKRMLSEGCKPSIPTMLLSLQAGTHLSFLHMGKTIHGYIIRLGFGSDVSVKGLLIDMYSKCGELSSACCVFSEISEGNICSWSCMINGLGMHGYGKEALMAFFGMLKRGIVPDDICFLLVLASCSHCGLITQGRKMFYYMVTQFGVQLKMEHYASMVDLIGRAGCIDEAFKFIREMPMEADCSVVGALLGACRIHGHLEMGKVFEECLEGSGWTAAGFYKLLLSIYAGDDRWDEVMKIRSVMEEKKVKGISGCSLI